MKTANYILLDEIARLCRIWGQPFTVSISHSRRSHNVPWKKNHDPSVDSLVSLLQSTYEVEYG
jgi:hypothetical protein